MVWCVVAGLVRFDTPRGFTMPSRPWVLRAVLVLACAVLPALLVCNPGPRPPQRPQGRATDLNATYHQLPEQPKYKDLCLWCDLRVSPASRADVGWLWKQVEADPAGCWCGWPLEEGQSPPRLRPLDDKLFQWMRIHDRTDPARWIGIGVWEMFSTGWSENRIVYRVPVGFTPEP
jgi:hypothetical protein